MCRYRGGMANLRPSLPGRPPLIATAALAALAVLAIPAAALLAQPAAGAFAIRETGARYTSLQQAVEAIGAGSGTIVVPTGIHRQCAVQQAGAVRFEAAEPGRAIFDGVACEGKAVLVLRGRSAEVDGLIFQNIAVPDFNGAGIRLERGDLTVRQSWFRASQQGILSATDATGRILIDKSTFTRLGTCEGPGGCAHSVYIGDYGSLTVTRSRFEQGSGGHYLKSRAARVDIRGNSFDDSAGTRTNYMIDLPAGAVGQIAGNWFVQGASKENYSAFVAVGAEDRLHSSAGLAIRGNNARIVPGIRRQTVFVADWSGEALRLSDNSLGTGLTAFERR